MTAGRMVGRELVWVPAAAGLPFCHLSPTLVGKISGTHVECVVPLLREKRVLFEKVPPLLQVTLMFPFSLPLPHISFLLSLWQALQEQAWAELPLCSHPPRQWRGWWSPRAGDPLFPCPQKWKPQTWVVFSLCLCNPCQGCCLHRVLHLAEASVIACLCCEWLGPGCLELISCSSHGCWLS